MADRPLLFPDRDLTNADWTKQTWDLPATSLPALRAYLKGIGVSVQTFKKLPVYQLNLARYPWLKRL